MTMQVGGMGATRTAHDGVLHSIGIQMDFTWIVSNRFKTVKMVQWCSPPIVLLMQVLGWFYPTHLELLQPCSLPSATRVRLVDGDYCLQLKLRSIILFSSPEFSADYPLAGGAFNYVALTYGEFAAWVAACDLILEYTLSAVRVIISVSAPYRLACSLLNLSKSLQTAGGSGQGIHSLPCLPDRD